MNLKWGIVVVVLCLMICGVSGAEFEDTVQNHWDMDSDGYGDADDLKNLWAPGWGGWADPGSSYSSIVEIDEKIEPYSEVIRLYVYAKDKGATGDAGAVAYIKSNVSSPSNYWSFVIRDASLSGGGTNHIRVYWYDKENTQIIYTDILSYVGSYHDNAFYEFLYESGSLYLTIDGTSQGVVSSLSAQPAYFAFYIGVQPPDYQSATYNVYIDDATVKEGIVGIGAEPCITGGFKEHSIIETTNNELDVSWCMKTLPFSEYTDAEYNLRVKRATWGEWYNTTQLKAAGNFTAHPCGFTEYNWTTLFQTDHYGLYWFSIYRTLTGEPELLSQDWIYFKNIGEPSTINIEDTEYAIGETLNISYYIDSPDFGANQYKIQIFDSTGQVKDTRVLTQQADTEQITSTIDWEEGMLYAVLVKDTKPAITEDPPEDIIDLAYDFCTMSNVIYVTGTVYDASNSDMLVDGTLLDNVSLNWTQAGTIYNTTSDANGDYEFIDATTLLEVEWFQDVPIEVTASKTNYTHDNFTMTIIKAGRYTVDIYLTPDVNMSATAINGLVQDDIFHQAISQATVKIWNGITNSTYTNNWGWYEFTGLANGTYYMTAEKETYRTSSVVTVPTFDVSYVLDTCDNLTYYEAVLDDCDATTGWSSENTLTLNTTDYIEATGSLQSRGYNTTDFNKTFSPGIDSNVSAANGYFYFYSKILNTTNISSTNVTVTISSNITGATDKRVWLINKTFFNDTWDLYSLKMSDSTQTGTCNLSNITYFEFKSTKTDNVTTRIDYLAFIEYAGWDSCLDLEIDTANKVEGTGSLNAEGKLYPTCDLVLGMFWTPAKDCTLINKDSTKSRLVYYQWDTQVHTDNVYLFDSDGDYVMWAPVMDPGWDTVSLYFSDAVESGDFETSKLAYLSVYSHTINYYDVNYDYVQLVQKGDTRQNFLLSQNYNLTVYAKDADTRYTITSFTAILDSTTVAETTTGAIVFPNVTYGIYPLEVSAEGYYTNKQYVFMGQDTTQTVYLTKVENVSGGGAGTYYAPHRVEFKVQNLFGYPVEDVVVNTTVLETTSLSWDWLWRALGMREDVAAEMQNGSMNGCTDSHGGISFLMEPTMRYRITFTKNGTNINESLTIYPKDDTYLVIVTTLTEERNRNEYVSWNLNTSDHNSTHAYLTFNYTDNLNKTSMLYFFVKDGNRTEIHNQTFTYDDLISTSHLVNRTKGQSYIWGFNCSHDEFGYFAQSKFITFKSRLIDLAILPDDKYYTWISIALLIFIAGLFSVTVSRFGYVIIPGAGLILSYIGWLSTNITLLTVAMGLGILAFMGKTERDKGL